MNLFRWLLAMAMWRLQCWGLCFRCPCAGGRHIDWAPVLCQECGWRGPLRWCSHSYGGCEDWVEYRDECPRCSSADLEL